MAVRIVLYEVSDGIEKDVCSFELNKSRRDLQRGGIRSSTHEGVIYWYDCNVKASFYPGKLSTLRCKIADSRRTIPKFLLDYGKAILN